MVVCVHASLPPSIWRHTGWLHQSHDRADDQELYFKYTEGSNQGQPKNIVLKSRDGAATTILNGEGSKRLFEIVDGTDTSLQIIGFTITNGGENDDRGGAMKIVGQSSWDNSTNQNVTNYSGVTFRDCIISGTHLITNGPNAPALYIERGHVRFINCKIKNNSNTAQSSETYGGVVRIEEGSMVDFIGCEVTDNACINNDYSYAWYWYFRRWTNSYFR